MDRRRPGLGPVRSPSNKGAREIRVILYAKDDPFCAPAPTNELSIEDILAVEHDIIPLNGADVFQQGEINSIGDRVALKLEDDALRPNANRRGNGTIFQIRSAYRDLCDWQAMRCPRLEVAAFE